MSITALSPSPIAAVPQASSPAPAPASNLGDTAVRPAVEWWEAGGQKYDSTADLVGKLQPSVDGVDASYHFRVSDKTEKPDPVWDTIGGAATGAAVGAGVAAAGVVALNILGVVGTVLTAGFYGAAGEVPILAPVLVLGGIGAAIGAVVGKNGSKEHFDEGSIIGGKILNQTRPDGTHMMFYPGGSLENSVDLNAFSKATPPPAPPDVPAQPWWKDSLKGAALGAGFSISSFVPLAGPFIPTAVGVMQGGRADANHPQRGAVLGGALGIGVTAATYGSMSAYGAAGLGVTVGACSAAGALLGPLVLPRLRAAAAREDVVQNQWWQNYQQQTQAG